MMMRNMVTTGGRSIATRLASVVAPVLFMALAFWAGQGFARDGKNTGMYGGGYSGPGPELVTVEQAKGMSDDARVALKGNIIQSLGGKHYVFKDATGTVTVEISDKRWQGQNIGPDDIVEIHGEVDVDWASVEIEVKRILKR